jgi:hypothetical protein
MASSGIRLGAWDYLKWGHIKPVFENGEVYAAKVRVYAEEDEEYLTFINIRLDELQEGVWRIYQR